MRQKQTLKQKDFDSYCMKQIADAKRLGSFQFVPSRNFTNVLAKIREMCPPYMEVNVDGNEIIIAKKQQPTSPQKKAGKSPLLPNAIYEPLRKNK